MSELKPVNCGCGGEAKVCSYLSREACAMVYYVQCEKCWIVTQDLLSKAEAVEVWNKAMGADHICQNCKNYDGSYCKFDNEYSIAKDYGCNCFERRES